MQFFPGLSAKDCRGVSNVQYESTPIRGRFSLIQRGSHSNTELVLIKSSPGTESHAHVRDAHLRDAHVRDAHARAVCACVRRTSACTQAQRVCASVRVEFLVRVSAFDVLKVPPEITADLQDHSAVGL